jgi:hypothetical protein
MNYGASNQFEIETFLRVRGRLGGLGSAAEANLKKHETEVSRKFLATMAKEIQQPPGKMLFD